jgi:hypothetical protein
MKEKMEKEEMEIKIFVFIDTQKEEKFNIFLREREKKV